MSIYIALIVTKVKPSRLAFGMSRYHATGPQFDCGLGKVHLNFHPIAVDKFSTDHISELNTECPALRWPSSRRHVLYCTSTPWSREQGGELYVIWYLTDSSTSKFSFRLFLFHHIYLKYILVISFKFSNFVTHYIFIKIHEYLKVIYRDL